MERRPHDSTRTPAARANTHTRATRDSDRPASARDVRPSARGPQGPLTADRRPAPAPRSTDLSDPDSGLISDATLESANQAGADLPVSAALAEDDDDTLPEPDETEVDLRSNAIVAGSLFDQPVSGDDDEEDEEDAREAEDDDAATLTAPLRSPQIVTDDPSDVDDDRLEESQRQLDERVKRRLRVDVLPGKRDAGEDR